MQARIRGTLIMALSNKFGWLVLTTGNKSELATGYATLYGDMSGGFAVIKDAPKTLVYRLAEYRNSLGPRPVIPLSVLQKPPSAELRPDQKDEDSLPPYSVLDPILKAYVEEDRTFEEIIGSGFDAATGEASDRAGGPQRVQAAPGSPRHQDHAPQLRPRPPHAHRQPLPAVVGVQICYRARRRSPAAIRSTPSTRIRYQTKSSPTRS